MKKLTMFHFEGCPYCAQAWKWVNELRKEEPSLSDVEIERIDEKKHPAIAECYDYYYVPTFYLEGKKLHEGAATKEKIERVLRAAHTA